MYFKKKTYLKENIIFNHKGKPILSIMLVTLLPPWQCTMTKATYRTSLLVAYSVMSANMAGNMAAGWEVGIALALTGSRMGFWNLKA